MEKFSLGNNKLIDVLDCDFCNPQVISAVGGGGKTSFCFTLARECVEIGLKVIVTTTTHMRVPEIGLSSTKDEIQKSLETQGCAIAGVHPFGHRMCGVEDSVYDWMCEQADVVIVEADGAKCLPVKAPDVSHEPVIPKNTTHTAILAGLSAIGKPMDEVCFRLTEIGKLLEMDDFSKPLTEELLAKILVKGYDKVVTHPCTYVLNQADDEDMYQKALRVASYYSDKKFIATSLYGNKNEKSPEERFLELIQ
ncbi:Molybdopterin-guanine dinucleotide biosynthesis protein MobA [Lachnospiraceae bacterium TWA4]|nr:Molybdopterin-guanine dinucleotide biosynthesis protein MobA [Lachnospiraceae bacterium TWA4]